MTLLSLHIDLHDHYGVFLLLLGYLSVTKSDGASLTAGVSQGVQIFSSYIVGLITTIVETLFNLAGALLIAVGLISMVIHL